MSTPRRTLASYTPSRAPTASLPPVSEPKKVGTNKWLKYLLILIALWIIVWLVLSALRPSWVQVKVNGTPTGVVDNTKCVLWSLLFAFLVTLIYWFFAKGE